MAFKEPFSDSELTIGNTLIASFYAVDNVSRCLGCLIQLVADACSSRLTHLGDDLLEVLFLAPIPDGALGNLDFLGNLRPREAQCGQFRSMKPLRRPLS